MDPARLIAIGDVHGCAHALDTLLEAICPTAADQLVFLGDLIDQGKETRDVLNRILDLQNCTQVTLIQGNHEEMLFAARDNEQARRYWENCGGAATLHSYRLGAKLDDIPISHWSLLESSVPFFETDTTIFTHANYLPNVPMADQPGYQLRWSLFESGKARPHVSGKTIVVGHTEQISAEVLDLGFALCIDTACWKYGWLTAIDMHSHQVWQVSRWGVPRVPNEVTQRAKLLKILRPSPAANGWPS